MQILKLKNILQSHGIAGAGGAGFPSYAKLNEKADTVILNCAECEPLLKLHRQLLERHAYEIISTLNTIAEAVGAKQFIVAVKAAYKGAVGAVKKEIGDFPKGKLHLLDEIYPAGDEVVTIYETTGRVVPPGGLPIEVGVTVYNVETVLNMYYAITKGEGVTHKFVTIAGEVKTPKTVCAPLGTRFSELIDFCGGETLAETAIVCGGPMTGRIADKNDTVTKTTNGILVMPKDHYIIEKKTQKPSVSVKQAMSICCQCRQCSELCSRNLLGHPISPSDFMRAVASNVPETTALLNTQYCSQCGLCGMYSCPQGLNPSALIGIYKSNLRKNGVKFSKKEKWDEVRPEREYRKVPMKRLIERIDVAKYDVDAPLLEDVLDIKNVKVMMSEHIGKPSEPSVTAGQRVKCGEIIANAAEGALSLPIHCPIDGVVNEVTDKYIIISKQKGSL